jgi:hypothetical protein
MRVHRESFFFVLEYVILSMSNKDAVQQIVCFSSRNAVSTEQGGLTWNCPTRRKCMKVNVASIEFPACQQNVRPGRDSVYVAEGVRVPTKSNYATLTLRLDVEDLSSWESARTAQSTGQPASSAQPRRPTPTCPPIEPVDMFEFYSVPIRVPSSGCRCTLSCTAPHRLIVHCENAHGLSEGSPLPHTRDGTREEDPIAHHLRSATVICATRADVLPCGELRLTERNVRVIDSFTFSMDSEGVWPSPRRLVGYLKFDAYESPNTLAAMFAHAANAQMPAELPPLVCSYEAGDNRFVWGFGRWPSNLEQVTATMRGPLADFMNISSDGDTQPRPLRARWADSTVTPTLPAASRLFQGCSFSCPWARIRFPKGWYAPCARPGNLLNQPFRFATTMSSLMNRLFIKPTSAGVPPKLTLRLPDGALVQAPILPGRYPPQGLAIHMTASIMAVVEHTRPLTQVKFRVTITTVCSIECWYVGRHGGLVQAAFSIDFAASDGLADLLAFPKTSLSGQGKYVGGPLEYPTFVDEDDEENGMRVFSNLYGVAEQEAARKLEFTALPPPVVLGVCTADNNVGEVLVETWVKIGVQPFASGHQVGDVVMIAAKRPEADEVQVMMGRVPVMADDIGWGFSLEYKDVVRAPVRAVVTQVQYHPPALRLFCPVARNLTIVRIWKTPEPACISVSPAFSGAIEMDALGFSTPLLQLRTNSVTRAARGYNLDPDYVNCTLNLHASKGPNLILDNCAGGFAPIFFRIVLSGSVVREGGLPKEQILSGGGESLSTFTLKFSNPDGTPYALENELTISLMFTFV